MSNTLMTMDDFMDIRGNLGKDDVILDVRRPDEFSQGHIKDALNIPVELVVQEVEQLRKYKHIYIHCKAGARAKTAFESLKQAGMDNLVCIHDAGMDAWTRAGMPVEK
jgi:phage shock protein E